MSIITKIKEYNYSNPATPLTKVNFDLAIKINKIRKQLKDLVTKVHSGEDIKKNTQKHKKLTKKLMTYNENDQARFFADMIKH